MIALSLYRVIKQLKIMIMKVLKSIFLFIIFLVVSLGVSHLMILLQNYGVRRDVTIIIYMVYAFVSTFYVNKIYIKYIK